MPLTTAPEWSKLRRPLLRIVAFTRTKLFELDGEGRSDFRRRSFRQHSYAAVVMRICARRGPCIVRGVSGNSFEAFAPHLCGHPVAELGIPLYERFRHIWFYGRHVRRQKQA